MTTALRAAGPLAVCAAIATAMTGLDVGAASGPAPTTPRLDAVPSELPAQHLPVVREHKYRMAGRVRMLLLWISRDDVGDGVIKWRSGSREHAYELLIGSDPQRAPGHLNKWGYLVEHVSEGESAVVGLISQGEERLSEVKAGLKSQQTRAFDTIRGRVAGNEACARVGTFYAPSHLTSREAATVLRDVLDNRSLEMKRIPRRVGVGGGFMSTLTEMIDANIRTSRAGVVGSQQSSNRTVPYVHGDHVYNLRMVESIPLARFERDGKSFTNVIRSRFETGLAGQRAETRFELVYGASGDLAGIPIVISYQPRWWLHVDLVLQT